jgi:hypothetical protein
MAGAPGRLAGDQAASRSHVAHQSVQFLAHVGLCGQGGRFQQDPVLAHRVARQFGHPPLEPFLDGDGLGCCEFTGRAHQSVDLRDQTAQQAVEGHALLAPRRGQAVERGGDRDRHGRLQRRLRLGILDPVGGFDHPLQRQQAIEPGRLRPAGRHVGLARREVALQLVEVQPHRARALRALRLHADGQLTALEPRLGALPGSTLEPLESGRSTEADLEVAAVDAAGFHGPAPGPQRALGPPEPGHSR